MWFWDGVWLLEEAGFVAVAATMDGFPSKQEISGRQSNHLSWEINTKDSIWIATMNQREWLAENHKALAVSHTIIDQIRFDPCNKISLVSKNALLPDISIIPRPPSPPFSYFHGIQEYYSWSLCQTPCHPFGREDWTHHHNLWWSTTFYRKKLG